MVKRERKETKRQTDRLIVSERERNGKKEREGKRERDGCMFEWVVKN